MRAGYLGAYHSVSVAEHDKSGDEFVLAFVQPLYNHVSVFKCSEAKTNSCALQSTFATTPLYGETHPTVAVAVSRRGRTLVVAGWAADSGSVGHVIEVQLCPFPACARPDTPLPLMQVYVYERAQSSDAYGSPVFSSPLYGGFGESGAPGRVDAAIAADGSRFIVGNGGTNGAATMFTLVAV